MTLACNILLCQQAVFDLPSRMRAALEEDALHSAVAYYAEAVPLLRKYGHRGAFRGIVSESDAICKELSAALKRRLAERKDDTEQVVLLLRQLGEGDDTLQVMLWPFAAAMLCLTSRVENPSIRIVDRTVQGLGLTQCCLSNSAGAVQSTQLGG